MLRTKNLQFAYGARASIPAPIAFPNIDVAQGGTLLLQGNSGSGKSTLLALACGLLSASNGEIEVAGQDLTQLQGAARDAWRGRNVGFVPQRLHVSESLSVQGNLGLVFYAAGLQHDASKIQNALQALGIEDLAQRKPSQLSGGQAQRVALARAVLLSPKIILADEPTASLDDEAASLAIELLLGSAKACGATLVVASHDVRVKAHLERLQLPFQAAILKQNRQVAGMK
jgi:putative ABC transport system ATP-binding protein